MEYYGYQQTIYLSLPVADLNAHLEYSPFLVCNAYSQLNQHSQWKIVAEMGLRTEVWI